MIIPHLVFAHFVGDYLLQTSWLVVRKSQGWDGLLLHGGIVFSMSLIAVAPYWEPLFLPLCLLFAVHTVQDWLKVWLGQRLRLHLAWAYFADQLGHYALIGAIGWWAQSTLELKPSDFEIFVMWLGAALIVVTRFYNVSWWSNWFEMIVYMNRWQMWTYAEHSAMLLLATLGAIPAVIALTFGLPRLFWAWRRGVPLWKQHYGMLEWSLGILLSVGLGYFGLSPLL